MDFIRLALVNLYKASPKQARQRKFFLRFFYYLFNNTNPIYKLSTAVKRTCRTEQNKAISYQFSLSLERVTTMPVCLSSSLTFNASARLVENFRIIGTLIPPLLRQRLLGSSNGGPQALLKMKSMHKFCFPCFS